LSVAGTITKLNKAKQIKNDEFYTRYEDIEKFISQYSEHLKDKVIYCNCDDTLVSVISINFLRLTLQS
jgi:modification methylase ecoRI